MYREQALENFYLVKKAALPYYDSKTGKFRTPSRAEWKAMSPLERQAFNIADQVHARDLQERFDLHPIENKSPLNTPKPVEPKVSPKATKTTYTWTGTDYNIPNTSNPPQHPLLTKFEGDVTRYRQHKVKELNEALKGYGEYSYNPTTKKVDFSIKSSTSTPVQSPRVGGCCGGGGGRGGRGRIGMLGTGLAAAGAVGLLGAVLHTRESRRRAKLRKKLRR